MKAAIELVESFLARPQPEPRRVFHGRGRCFPGLEHLCVDWYPPIMLVTAYAPLQDSQQLKLVIEKADLHQQVETLILQQRDQDQSPSQILAGKEQDYTEVLEQGLKFEVHPGRRQNAGLFLDTRPLRGWLLENSADCKVLNLFAYTCSLSVATLAGGADSVTNVDISKPSIAWGARNHQLNDQSLDQVHAIPYNLFTSWGRIRQFGRYDLVIMDPPTRQRRAFDAEKDYGAVLRKLPKCLNQGARIVAALNSPFHGWDFLERQFEKNLPGASLQEVIPAAPEFTDIDPDKALKIGVFAVP